VLDRRTFLSLTGAAWLPAMASAAQKAPSPKRCIVLWMSGGPAQTDTFDLKPGHANGGPFKAIKTAVPDISIGEHLPKLAERMKQLAVVRSMATREGDHGRATQHMHLGYLPQGAIEFPTFGSAIAKERDRADADLPGFVSISSRGLNPAALTPGFLGPRFAPLIVGSRPQEDGVFATDDGGLGVENLDLPRGLSSDRARERLDLLNDLQAEFREARPGIATSSHQNAYERAQRLMRESAARAFKLSEEKEPLRDRYGRSRFGQGCLLARRLVERDVPFVEVSLGGWDTHTDNFNQVKNLCGTVDTAWSALLDDLSERGLLDSTLIVWMGEFGRTPVINPRQGRDHFPNAWSVALAGGGIRGGQVVGRTSADGMTVEDRPVTIPDLLATLCGVLGIDAGKQNMSNVGRPIRIVDVGAKPIREVLS